MGSALPGMRLVLLLPNSGLSGLADRVADVFRLSIHQAFNPPRAVSSSSSFFVASHPDFTTSLRSSPDAKTSRKWDHGSQNSRETSSILPPEEVLTKSSTHTKSSVRLTYSTGNAQDMRPSP